MSFYAVLPFHILVNEELKPNEIKLYGIVSALTNTNGYCFASNAAIADYFRRDGKAPSHNTVSQWMSRLVDMGFLTRELIYDVDQKTVIERRIRLSDKIEPKKAAEKVEKPKVVTYDNEISEIIQYLNHMTGKKFGVTIKKYRQHIQARFNDGKTIEDFVKVIDTKCADEWFIKNPQYLSPDTLFRPANFDKYLNEWVEPTKQETKYDDDKPKEINLAPKSF